MGGCRSCGRGSGTVAAVVRTSGSTRKRWELALGLQRWRGGDVTGIIRARTARRGGERVFQGKRCATCYIQISARRAPDSCGRRDAQSAPLLPPAKMLRCARFPPSGLAPARTPCQFACQRRPAWHPAEISAAGPAGRAPGAVDEAPEPAELPWTSRFRWPTLASPPVARIPAWQFSKLPRLDALMRWQPQSAPTPYTDHTPAPAPSLASSAHRSSK